MYKIYAVSIALALGAAMYAGAQEQAPEQLQQQLQKLEQDLRDVYSKLYDLKQQLLETPSPELKEKIDRLTEQAGKLEHQIQEIYARKHTFSPEKQMPPHSERKDKFNAPKSKSRNNFKQQIRAKKEELKEIQQQLQQAQDEEEREILELYSDKLREELKMLQKKKKHRSRRRPHERRWKHRDNFQPWQKHHRPQRKPVHRKHFAPLSQGEQKKIMQRIKEEFPKKFAQLEKMRQSRPHQFRKHIQKAAHQLHKLDRLQKEDPQAYATIKRERQLQHAVHELAQSIRNTQGEERNKLIAELRVILNKLFEVRLQKRELEMDKLAKKIEAMRETVKKRIDNKETIVEMHLHKLIGEGDEWEW